MIRLNRSTKTLETVEVGLERAPMMVKPDFGPGKGFIPGTGLVLEDGDSNFPNRLPSRQTYRPGSYEADMQAASQQVIYLKTAPGWNTPPQSWND